MARDFLSFSASFPLNYFLLFTQTQSAFWDIPPLDSLRTGSPEILPIAINYDLFQNPNTPTHPREN